MEQAKVTVCKQYFIDWASVGGYEQFLSDYRNAPDYEQRRYIVDSVLLQKNREWANARRGHITASNIKDFLTKGRAKGDLFGKGAQGVIRKYMAELLGWEEQDQRFSEMFHVKRGLIFERRARELFAKETGLEVKSDIGFISREINGIKFGCSPDGYIIGKDGTIESYVEIKSFELQGFLEATETLGSKEMQAQMQAQMMVADCPRCYAIWYCAELDKIVYLKYTRGLAFRREIEERIPLALDYMKKLESALKYTDLTDKIMAGEDE
jgi:Zn-finger nucleic acid-binding protein